MTTLISWTGVDPRGSSSIYLASDSRISWDKKDTWDNGRKLFSSINSPEMFGFCGDVVFPIQVLGQIVEQIDNGVLFVKGEEHTSKQNKVYALIKKSFKVYPNGYKNKFRILYATKISEGMDSEFYLSSISWNPDTKWKIVNHPLPSYSGLIESAGTGEQSIKDWYIKWQSSESNRTSRSVFSAFCQSLSSGDDPLSGGSPQLLGIYREGNAKTFGIIHNNRRYLNGIEITNNGSLNNIEWRNELFERYDGDRKKIIVGAQRQPLPNNLKQ